jgi:hypothetical protein
MAAEDVREKRGKSRTKARWTVELCKELKLWSMIFLYLLAGRDM